MKKKQKEKEIVEVAQYMYKCRRCGEIYSNKDTSLEIGFKTLVSTLLGLSLGIEPPMKMNEIHQCNDTNGPCGMGIADLIGYDVGYK